MADERGGEGEGQVGMNGEGGAMHHRLQNGLGLNVKLVLVGIGLLGLVVWLHHYDSVKQQQVVAAHAAEESAAAQDAARQAQAAEKQAAAERANQAAQQRQHEAAQRETGRAMVSLKAISTRWLDAVAVADGTARVALSGPVANLQAIRRDAENLQVPSCLADAKAKLIESMDAFLRSNLVFMGHADFTASLQHGEGLRLLREFANAVQIARCDAE